MSFLTLPDGIPDFSKAVISFWFRVPQESIDAASAAFVSEHRDAPPLFNGIIPLVVMGQKGVVRPFSEETVPYWLPDVPTDGDPSFYLTTTSPTGKSFPTNPFVIGVDCSRERPVLHINIETNKKANVSDFAFDLRAVSPESFTYVNVTNIVTDLTATINGTNIYLGPNGDSGADKWHHLLVSLELKTINTHGIAVDESYTGIDADYVDGAAELFVALDDVDYTEFDLSDYYVRGTENHNKVVPEYAMKVAGAPQVVGYTDEFPFVGPLGGVKQYTLDAPKIPCQGHPIGLPGTTEFLEKVWLVEMAEFQMWAGVTLNTGDEANRRAFVDADGNPVLPEGTDDDPRAPAEILLGKKPDIMLHGSGDWIDGKNTGTTGVDDTVDPPEEKPEGQFEPTGGIEAYTPDPSLHETTA